MIDSIGFGATTKTTNKIMKGTPDIDTITNDSTSKNLFEIFKISKLELKIEVTKEKMMDQYKKWNEHTATSLVGRHLGHCHTLFRPFKYDLDNVGDKAELEEKK